MQTGVSAYTQTWFSYALKALKGDTEQAVMYKSTDDNQILAIHEVYENRDVEFKLSHSTDDDGPWTDSTWQTVDITSTYPRILQIHGGMFSGNQYVATFIGYKKLTMQTKNIYIGVTGLYGNWWLSETEYNQFNNM